METLVAQNYDLAFRYPAHLLNLLQAATGGSPWWRRKRKTEMVTFVGSDGGSIQIPASVITGLLTALFPLLREHRTVTISIGPPRTAMNGDTISDILLTPAPFRAKGEEP